MAIEHDVETITETIAESLVGENDEMASDKFKIAPLVDLGEIFIRTPSGSIFKITVEEASSDDYDGFEENEEED